MCLTGSANPKVLVYWANQVNDPKELDRCRDRFRKTVVVVTVIVLAAIATIVIGALALKEIYFSMAKASACVCIGLGGLIVLYNLRDIKNLYQTNSALSLKRASFVRD